MTPMQQMIITQMVARFLTWPVPADVYPDGTPGQPGRSGTNLLSSQQAEEMLRHVTSGQTLADAIAWVQKRRDDYVDAYGNTDPETGAVEFGRGAHAEARATYVMELDEIIEGLSAQLCRT